MNVTIKPLVWRESVAGEFVAGFGSLGVVFIKPNPGGGWFVSSSQSLLNTKYTFPSISDAKDHVEWVYTNLVLDLLEPADRDAVGEFAKLREG